MSAKLAEPERVAQIDACLANFAAGRGLELAEVREEWAERAAHHEYMGGTIRRNAELYAIRDVFTRFGRRLKAKS